MGDRLVNKIQLRMVVPRLNILAHVAVSFPGAWLAGVRASAFKAMATIT